MQEMTGELESWKRKRSNRTKGRTKTNYQVRKQVKNQNNEQIEQQFNNQVKYAKHKNLNQPKVKSMEPKKQPKNH